VPRAPTCTPRPSSATPWRSLQGHLLGGDEPDHQFTTLFGLLATEIAVAMTNTTMKYTIGGVIFLIALIFVARSFYGMRIPEEK